MTDTPRPILFVSSPEAGLLNPMLVLAGELARRGVPDLYFATDDNRRDDIEGIPGPHGVDFVSLGPVKSELSAVTWSDKIYRKVTQPSRWKALRAVALHTFDPNLSTPKYQALDAAVQRIKPALMVIDNISGFATKVAITRNIPYVLSAPFMASNVLFHLLPKGYPRPNSGLPLNMTPAQRRANKLWRLRMMSLILHPKMIRNFVKYGKVRKELGASPAATRPSSKAIRAELILCHSVAELDYPFPLPDKLRLLGAMIPPLPQSDPAEDPALSAWLDERDSIVYMGFGTITRLSRQQVHALVDVARRLAGKANILWKLPKEQQPLLDGAGDLPDNLRIENWVPSQLDVLAHPNVKVFVNHGGGNGVHEGLYFGKPLLTRPLWVDCYDQAVRAEDAGVSLTLDAQVVDVPDMVGKIERLLTDDSFRNRAEQFRALQLAAGGRETAGDLILQLPVLSVEAHA